MYFITATLGWSKAQTVAYLHLAAWYSRRQFSRAVHNQHWSSASKTRAKTSGPFQPPAPVIETLEDTDLGTHGGTVLVVKHDPKKTHYCVPTVYLLCTKRQTEEERAGCAKKTRKKVNIVREQEQEQEQEHG